MLAAADSALPSLTPMHPGWLADTPVRYVVYPWIATVTQGSINSIEGVSLAGCREAEERAAAAAQESSRRLLEQKALTAVRAHIL